MIPFKSIAPFFHDTRKGFVFYLVRIFLYSFPSLSIQIEECLKLRIFYRYYYRKFDLFTII